MDDTSIRSEMHKIAQERIAADVVTVLDDLVYGVLETRAGIEGEDAEFYRVHTFRELRRIAKGVVGKYDSTATTDDQLILPGFKYLCRAYPMTRDGAVVLVPVNRCTDDELVARAAQLDEMAKGCVAHALEIREYVMARGRIAA